MLKHYKASIDRDFILFFIINEINFEIKRFTFIVRVFARCGYTYYSVNVFAVEGSLLIH
jgi:hypothetical protein